jgi:hypothetical protein
MSCVLERRSKIHFVSSPSRQPGADLPADPTFFEKEERQPPHDMVETSIVQLLVIEHVANWAIRLFEYAHDGLRVEVVKVVGALVVVVVVLDVPRSI